MSSERGRPFEKGVPRTVGGTRKGIPNKATLAARQAIAKFVDGNAHRLQKWLDQVADGVQGKIVTKQGEVIDGAWVVPPNPERAFDMFQSVIEYHIPKLARTELTGKDGEPLTPPRINIGFGNGGPGSDG